MQKKTKQKNASTMEIILQDSTRSCYACVIRDIFQTKFKNALTKCVDVQQPTSHGCPHSFERSIDEQTSIDQMCISGVTVHGTQFAHKYDYILPPMTNKQQLNWDQTDRDCDWGLIHDRNYTLSMPIWLMSLTDIIMKYLSNICICNGSGHRLTQNYQTRVKYFYVDSYDDNNYREYGWNNQKWKYWYHRKSWHQIVAKRKYLHRCKNIESKYESMLINNNVKYDDFYSKKQYLQALVPQSGERHDNLIYRSVC